VTDGRARMGTYLGTEYTPALCPLPLHAACCMLHAAQEIAIDLRPALALLGRPLEGGVTKKHAPLVKTHSCTVAVTREAGITHDGPTFCTGRLIDASPPI
jgi:hypothetical protein